MILLTSFDFVQLTWVANPAYSVVRLRDGEWAPFAPLLSSSFTLLLWCQDTKSNKMVELLFESLQMDLRYWVRYKMHRLGIWVNVKVYLFMWIYIKSFVKHLFVLSYTALKASLTFDVHLDEWVLSWPQLHLSFCTWHQESLLQSFWVNLHQESCFWLGCETCLPWRWIRLNSNL